jgi:hypothetical protein
VAAGVDVRAYPPAAAVLSPFPHSRCFHITQTIHLLQSICYKAKEIVGQGLLDDRGVVIPA